MTIIEWPSTTDIVLLEDRALYMPGRTHWDEHIQYEYREGVHELRVCLAGITQPELEDLLHGAAEFALVADGPMLLLLFTFGKAFGWSDAPFTIWRVKADKRSIPASPQLGTVAVLHLNVVDASTGLLLGQRYINLSTAFSYALLTAIRRQAAESLAPEDVEERVAAVRDRYPTPEALLAVAIAQCTIPADR